MTPTCRGRSCPSGPVACVAVEAEVAPSCSPWSDCVASPRRRAVARGRMIDDIASAGDKRRFVRFTRCQQRRRRQARSGCFGAPPARLNRSEERPEEREERGHSTSELLIVEPPLLGELLLVHRVHVPTVDYRSRRAGSSRERASCRSTTSRAVREAGERVVAPDRERGSWRCTRIGRRTRRTRYFRAGKLAFMSVVVSNGSQEAAVPKSACGS